MRTGVRNVIALHASAGPDDPRGRVASLPRETAAGSGVPCFMTPALEDLEQRLVEDLPGSHAVFLLQAPAGSGKSVFLQRFVAAAPPDWTLVAMRLCTPLGEAQLVRHLNLQLFPEETLDGTGLMRRILTRSREAAPLVLAIDDAERLSPFALGLLLRLKQAVAARGGRLGLLLLATGAVERLLETPSIVELGTGLVEHIAFPVFSEEETACYVREHLKMANGLDERDMRLLHRWSGGRPGAIRRLLSRRSGADKTMSRPALAQVLATYRHFLLSLAVFALLFAGGYVLYEGDSRSSMEAALPEVPPLSFPPAEGPSSPPLSPPVEAAPGSGGETAAPPNPKAVAAVPVQGPAGKTAAVRPPPTSPDPGAAGAGKSKTVSRTPQAAGQPPPAQVRGVEWLMAQDAGTFTIQLTSWADKARAIRYIRDNGLLKDAAYVHTRSKGKDWYLVLYRTYPSLGAAKKAIAALPAPLKKYAPWVRNVSSLQSLAVLE